MEKDLPLMKENGKLSINFYIIKTFSALTKAKSKKKKNKWDFQQLWERVKVINIENV